MTNELRNRLILAFYLPSVLVAIAWAVMTPVLPVYAETLTESFAIIGIMLAAASFGRVLGSIPTSWLLERFGIKQTMLIGIWITILPMLALFAVSNLWLTIALLFVVGFGLSIYSIARHTYIAVVIPLEIRGRAIALLGGVFRTGLFIGPLIGGWVGETFGLQAAFLAVFFIGVMSVGFVMRFMRNIDAPTNDVSEKAATVPFRTMLRENRKIITAAGLAVWLVMLTREGWRVIIPLYASSVLDLNVQTIGFVMSFGAAFDMIFFWMAGILMDRYGRKWAIVPSFLMQGIGTGLILLAGNVFALAGFAAFIGFANSLSSGTMMTTGADLAPPASRNQFLSLWHFIADMGGVSGPVIVGFVAEAFIIQFSVLSVASAGLGAAFLFAVFVPETLKKKIHAN